jgi:HSP20 family molecular chaperone IbpA
MTTQEIQAKQKQPLAEAEQKTRTGRFYVPSIDICEDDEALWLFADLPGVEQGNVKVEVNDNVLTIEGRVSLEEYESLSPIATEYNVGNYFRRFTLPSAHRYDREKVSARLSDGELEIKLPKTEAVKPRRVEVTAG